MKRIGYPILLIALIILSCEKEKVLPQKPLPPTPGTTIFLDTSMSMRGYFRASPAAGTTIQRFMLADLLGILSEDRLTPIYLSLFGSAIPAPEEIKSLRRWSFFKEQKKLEDTYPQKETNLIGVFENEYFGKNTVSIIVTDGIQSSMEGSQNIIADFDTRIFNVINDKNNSGIYLWLIGVRSEFNGYIYPERPNPQGIRAPFWYSGIRPIYIWIASHDAETGRNLVEKITARLRSIAGSSGTVKVAGLTSVSHPFVDIGLDTGSSSSPISSKPVGNSTFEWLVGRTQEDILSVPINIDAPEDKLKTAFDIEWDINLELEPKGIRWAKVIKNDEGWTLNLTYALIPGSGFMSGCNSSKGNLKVVAKAIPKINPEKWWQHWSTEDDSLEQNAGKTLYLEKLSQIIEEPLRKSYPAGEVSLKVKKP